MKFLLDTHVLLWFISGDTRLPAGWRDTIRQPHHEVYLSVVSLWETILKYQLGKLAIPEPPERYLPTQRERHQIANLPLDEASVQQLATLPPIHRDPFDRMLICQAIEHKLTIITVDDVFRAYPAPVLERA
ncbi:MAG: type II toxin-antitoxin system VapC family toxin [Candidatus Binatia bacterium]